MRSKQRLPAGRAQSQQCSLLPCPCLTFSSPPLLVRPFVCPQYDNRADDLTKDGMLKGIESSAAFVLFLSTGVLERPYCQMEIRHALALKKPVVLLHGESEIDEPMHDRCYSLLTPALHRTCASVRPCQQI